MISSRAIQLLPRWTLVVLACSLAFSQTAQAQERVEVGRGLPPVPPPEAEALDAKLSFLTSRIRTQRIHAEWWWTSFIGFYSAGLAVQTLRASSRGEGFFLFPGDNAAERADLIYSAVKAAGGVIRFAVQPFGGIEGTHAYSHLPESSVKQKRAKVARAEAVLANNADATTPFGPWFAHIINAAVNGAGILITGIGYDDWQTGAISAGIGFAVGELTFITQPWEADGDLEEYETRFSADVPLPDEEPEAVTLHLAPMGAGLGLVGTF